MGLLDLFGLKSSPEKQLKKAQAELSKLTERYTKAEQHDNSQQKLDIIKHVFALTTGLKDFDCKDLQKKAIDFLAQRAYSDTNQVIKLHLVSHIGQILQAPETNETVVNYGLGFLVGILKRDDHYRPNVRSAAFSQIDKLYKQGKIPLDSKTVKPYVEQSRVETDASLKGMLISFARWTSTKLLRHDLESVGPSSDFRKYKGDNVIIRMGKSILTGEVSSKEDILHGIDFILECTKNEINPDLRRTYVEIMGTCLASGRLKEIVYNKNTGLLNTVSIPLEDRVWNGIVDVALTPTKGQEPARISAQNFIVSHIQQKAQPLSLTEYDALVKLSAQVSKPMKDRIKNLISVLGTSTSRLNDAELDRVTRDVWGPKPL